MKPFCQASKIPAALCVVAAAAAFQPSLVRGGILNGDQFIVPASGQAGNLSVSGNNLKFGTTQGTPQVEAVQLWYADLSCDLAMVMTESGSFSWMDNNINVGETKMVLGLDNTLSLYRSDIQSVGMSLNPTNGRITLSGTGSGLYSGSTPLVTTNGSGGVTFGPTTVFSGGATFSSTATFAGATTLASTTVSTSSFTGALTVAGGIGIAKDSYINGIRIGLGPLASYNNLVVGRDAFQSITQGGDSVAVGFEALKLATTSYGNTAVGSLTLRVNTTGSSNTALGYSGLKSNLAGGYNVATGSFSLTSNTSGSYNVATGASSLLNNTSGGDNVATGAYSLFTNTTGSYNTASGYQSLYLNSTGSQNVAYGRLGLRNTTTGINNTAVGSEALYGNTTGSSNVAIGMAAGRFQPNGTTLLADPENSIYIGANSRGFSNADSNSIVIGHTAIGEGANTTVIGNSSTTKTHLYGETNANSLKVAGATVLDGSVIISVVQGDISMGIYE
ncbi:hypothetical protein [Luteolibacter sp. Populi]|uniref:hypothetical protein n=1 Tax=Luteolibacter sp. Populi TaxID=3230487 RepID=UPI0034653EB7